MSTGGIDFNRVATFVEIAANGGVTAAATKMKLPKSSVSRALSQLEAELGVELVARGSRRFSLTEAGAAFYESAAKGVAAVVAAREQARDVTSKPRGVVRIAAPSTIATWVLSPVVARFVREFPEITVDLRVTGAALEPTRDGFDIVLGSHRVDDASLRVRPLGPAIFAAYASEGYLAAHGTPKRPHDLARHTCILPPSTARKSRWALSGPKGDVVVPVETRICVDDLMTATAIASADGGIALLPLHHPGKLAFARSLVRVLPDYTVQSEPMQLILPSTRHLPLRVRLFVDRMVEATTVTCKEHAPENVAPALTIAHPPASVERPARRSGTDG